MFFLNKYKIHVLIIFCIYFFAPERVFSLSVDICGTVVKDGSSAYSIYFPKDGFSEDFGGNITLGKEELEGLYGYSGVVCIQKEMELENCSDTKQCPFGTYCVDYDSLSGKVGSYCKSIGKCTKNEDCNNLFGEKGDGRSYLCHEGSGLCIYDLPAGQECSCPFGADASGVNTACNTPHCSVAEIQSGVNLCSTSLNKCINPYSVPEAGACSNDLQCWAGVYKGESSQEYVNAWITQADDGRDGATGKGVAKCCQANKCNGPIEACLQAHPGYCPPNYRWNVMENKCLDDCESKFGKECFRDSDCKIGEECKKYEGIDPNSSCSEKKFCQKKIADFITNEEPQTKEPVVNIPFIIPSTAGLNQIGAKTVPTLIGNIISGAMGIIGSIALVMFIYGGVTWMTAMGNSEKTKKGMQIIFWSAMGIVIIFSSWIMINFLLEGFK